MSWIWHTLIKAIQLEYDPSVINYVVSDENRLSPYIEQIPLALYDPENIVSPEEIFNRVEVNPYLRFSKIFTRILNPERDEPNDEIVCDLVTHVLADIDRICGMSKRDFQLVLIVKDLDSGCFGDDISLFSAVEKKALAQVLLLFYKIPDFIQALLVLFSLIMRDVYLTNRDNTELVFYIPRPFDESDDMKLRFIIKIFVPIDFTYVIHWQYTYGVIDRPETIRIDRFVL